ncbi:MAG: hypothetical protein WC863_02920 [Patescibacteria group bacterium]
MWEGRKIEKLLKIFIFIGLVALIVLIFSQQIQLTVVDLGRHLANGRIVWSDARVLFTNFYSYTEPNFPFLNHHWLAGVIFYLIYLTGGFKLLSVFNIILVSAAFILAFRLARRQANFYLIALLSIPTIFLLSERVEIRPEIISYLLIILVWLIIDRVAVSKNYRRLLWLLPIFVFWVNTHIYFFIGLALLGFKFLAEFLPPFFSNFRSPEFDWLKSLKAGYAAAKIWLKILGAAILACLINPSHIKALFYPFTILHNSGYEIVENKTIWFLEQLMVNYNFSFFKILLGVLIISWLFYFLLLRKLPLFNLLITIFFVFFSLLAVRNLAISGLVFLVLISDNLSAIIFCLQERLQLSFDESGRLRLIFAGGLIFLIFSSFVYLWQTAARQDNFIRQSLGWGLNQGALESAEFFKASKLSGPIFNNYDLGSYLAFNLYPQEKIFVDNRPEAYSQKFFSDIYKPMQSDPAKWQEYSTKYKIKTVYFAYTDSTPWAQNFLRYLLNTPDWILVYFDRYTVILVNKKLTDSAFLKKYAIDIWLFKERWRELEINSDLHGLLNLASLARAANRSNLAEEVYRQIIFRYPSNRPALSSLASLYASSQDPINLKLALEYFRRAVDAGDNLPGIYNEMGLVNWRLGLYQKAEANWRSALELDHHNESALYYLKQLAEFRRQGKID